MTVVKELTVDTAHMLSNYDGKCNNLHGHTYKIKVAVEGNVVNDMVLDFNVIKEVFDKYDHAIVFAGEEEREPFEEGLLNLVQTYKKKHLVLPSAMRPTAENMAKLAIDQLRVAMQNQARSIAVEVWETPTSYAAEEWTR